jgi:hypothetical protein
MKTASAKIAALAALLLAVGTPVYAIDMSGRIILPNQSVKALVLLSYAVLKTNIESSITLGYPLLPTRAQTDARGNFTIPSLNPQYLYSGYIVAPECKPKWLNQIDPASQLNVSLEPADSGLLPGKVLHGHILDTNGNPVSGALIKISGSTRNGTMSWPAFDVDAYAVSGRSGDFVITGKTNFDAVDGTVSAEGFADADFVQWPSDADNQEWADTGNMPRGLASFAKPLHQMTLVKGASLEGTLLNAGKPVAHAELRLNACGAGSSCWDWKGATLTDDNGRFIFPHLPPNQSLSICGNWDLLASGYAVHQTNIRLGENNSASNIGAINVDPVCPVAGKIVLSDGNPLPPKSFYYLLDYPMGYSSASGFGAGGSFHFPSVPGHQIFMYLRIPGYVFTPRDLQLKSGSMTNITVSAQSTNLVYKMQPYSRPSRLR